MAIPPRLLTPLVSEIRPRRPAPDPTARTVILEGARQAARARASATMATATALRLEALASLRAVLADDCAPALAIVAGAREILAATRDDPRALVLALLGGDEDRYREWLLAELAALDRGDAAYAALERALAAPPDADAGDSRD